MPERGDADLLEVLGAQPGQQIRRRRRCRGKPARTAPGPARAAKPRCPTSLPWPAVSSGVDRSLPLFSVEGPHATPRTDRTRMGAAAAAPASDAPGGRGTIGPSSTPCSGWPRPGRRGATCPSGSARGGPWRPGSTAGPAQGCGIGSSPSCGASRTPGAAIDWEVHMVDGTSVRAHRCAAGGKGGGSARRWAAPVAGSAASCTCAATAGAGRWRSC